MQTTSPGGLDDPDPATTSPCDDQVEKDEIDADAAAAEARKEFARRAAARGENMAQREWAAVVYRGSDGRLTFGNVTSGELIVPGAQDVAGVPINYDGIPAGDIFGVVHSRPGGLPKPSGGDKLDIWPDLKSRVETAAGTAALAQLRMYIATYGGEGGQNLYTYNDANMNAVDAGPQVDPNAQPCDQGL